MYVNVLYLSLVPDNTDCYDIKQHTNTSNSGVYTILLDTDDGQVRKEVYCDMVTDGGGWTVSIDLHLITCHGDSVS